MTAAAFVSAFGFVMVGLGWLITEWLDRKDVLSSLERAAASFVIGCYVLYLGVFFSAPFRLDQLSVWSLLAGCALAAAFGWNIIPWPRWFDSIRKEFSGLRTDFGTALLWAVLIGIAFSSVMQALAPPNDYDGLAYHLAFPRLDVEQGRAVLALKTGWPATFFPALGSHLTRVALVVADGGAAQMIHALFGLVGAIAAAALVQRLGYGKKVALAAAILFLSVRMVVWQMGSVETDVPVGALAVLALLIYIATRDNKSPGLEVIFGLIVAAVILMKYHGLVAISALVPLILYDLATSRKPIKLFVIGPIVALAAIAPHLVRDFMLTGNPIYPLMSGIFNPGLPDLLSDFSSVTGSWRDLVNFIVTPWTIFILPTQLFDGMMIGAPYFLALGPLILADRAALKKWGPALSYSFAYYILWFWLISQQVRFLAPVMPVFSGLAAAGVAHYWYRIRSSRLIKGTFVLLLAVLAINQSMFVGILSIIRLPVAVGLMSPEFYHNNTPTMNGAFYSTCKYVEKNIRDGEKYFLYAPYVSYYCPQSSAFLTYFEDEEGWWMKSKTPPQMTKKEFLRRLNVVKFRYFLVQESTEFRGGAGSITTIRIIAKSKVRFRNYLNQAFSELTPLKNDHFSAVYDGAEVLGFLNKQVQNQ